MSNEPKVWVAHPVFEDALARLREFFDVEAATEQQSWAPEQLRERLAQVDAAVVGLGDRVDAQAIEGNQRLRAVANIGVGHNNLDLEALTAAGIVASNTPDVLTESTADYAWALLMAAARRVGAADRWVRAGQWHGGLRLDDWLGVDIHGKTLGILGMGRIGQAIARRAAGFAMPVRYHNRHRLTESVERDCRATWVERDALFEQADHLVLALPYTKDNHHVVNAAALKRMKPGVVLINIARGGIVDELALAQALREGHLAAAGLDVFEGEPSVRPELMALDQVVLSPHIASASQATRRAMANLAADNLIAALGFGPDAGRPPSTLNPEALQSR